LRCWHAARREEAHNSIQYIQCDWVSGETCGEGEDGKQEERADDEAFTAEQIGNFAEEEEERTTCES